MSATLRQIATAAQVSVSTASRALNGHPAISARTIANVRQAAEELSYRQRRAHGRLDARRSLSRARIGVLSLGMDRSLIALPIIAAALGGAEAGLSEAGATVQLTQVPDLAQSPRSLRVRQLDGLILVGALQGDLLARAESELMPQLRNLPTVWLVGRPRGCWGDAVTSNDYETGVRAAEHLFARGHRRLAFVNPKPDHLLFMRREDGFVATARRLGAEVHCFSQTDPAFDKLPSPAPTTVDTVQRLVDRLIAMRVRPTAIFAAADSVAALVYRACAVRNLRVGSDVSVISGNNDAALIAGLHPHLTTFDIHADAIGQLAVRQLALRLACPGVLPDCELMVQPTLIAGESVAELVAPSTAPTLPKRNSL